MKKKIIRYAITVLLLILAFILFSNRNTGSFSYRSEIKSLKVETDYTTDLYVTAYTDFLDERASDTEALLTQRQAFDTLIRRYKELEDLPDSSSDDYQELLLTLEEQLLIMDDIILSIETTSTVPGEYRLALKKLVEKRVLYEGLMRRY